MANERATGKRSIRKALPSVCNLVLVFMLDSVFERCGVVHALSRSPMMPAYGRRRRGVSSIAGRDILAALTAIAARRVRESSTP